jgi:hypothetical protein
VNGSRAALIGMVAMLAGCSGHLDVRVDVLDPVYVKTLVADANLRGECASALLESPATIEINVAKANADLLAAREEFVKVIRAIAAELPDKKQADAMRAFADGFTATRATIDSDYGLPQYRVERLEANDAIRAARGVESAQVLCQNLNPELAQAILAWRKVVAAKSRFLEEKLDELRSQRDQKLAQLQVAKKAEPSPVVKEAAKEAEVDFKRALRTVNSPIGDGALGDSQFAFAVASIPESQWRQDFNKAFAQGRSGNVDIAVVLNQAADFSVKGMRFDATKVAQVASKVTTQSLLLAASIAGVPVGKAGGSGAAPPATGSTGGSSAPAFAGEPDQELTAAESALHSREALEKQRKEALIAVADAIARQVPRLDSKEGRDSAKTVLSATFDGYRNLLVLDGYQ